MARPARDFAGVDAKAADFDDAAGTTTALAPWQVRHLQEISN